MKKIIVGLGNPGKQYMPTPHNIGFSVIDELAGRFALNLRRSFRFRARLANGNIEGVQVTLAKPNAFMNMSGAVVAALIRHKCFAVQDLIVITDDANLPEGQLRIRTQGSSGGHKGLQSIIHNLGHDRFARLRLGIGQAGNGSNLIEHVLMPFPPNVRGKIENMIGKATDAVVFWLKNGAEAAMNMFNKPTGEDII
ncbi:MAG: aminoacyl-tRNA hydrolase [Kiritimatiellia bacterium]|nr:aminoacyl-tRNA hydrolase [Kiritimatiellia bacterium]